MLRRRLIDRQTPARRAWLERLDQAPGTVRTHRIAFECMRLGWTQWKTGSGGDRRCGEELTAAGRAVLEQWRAEERAAGVGIPPTIV